jgi:hypothetical protein
VSFLVRDDLLITSSDTFFITDHYRNHPSVLGKLTVVRRAEMRQLLEESWRQVAPPRLIAELDART